MSRSIADIKTLAVVLRRTNYAEADRILNLLTPDGKKSALARGVRKARSKLAGGVEMFSLIEVNLHAGRGEMAIVTSARMVKYYGAILADYGRMELASMMLRKTAKATEGADSPEYFATICECLEGLNDGLSMALVESWFLMRVLKTSGEEINLYRDESGNKLVAGQRYDYDVNEGAFVENSSGKFGTNEIKLLRLMTTASLKVVSRVQGLEECLPEILRLVRMVSQMN